MRNITFLSGKTLFLVFTFLMLTTSVLAQKDFKKREPKPHSTLTFRKILGVTEVHI